MMDCCFFVPPCCYQAVRAKTGQKKMEDMNLEELDELEDDEDEEILEKYRYARTK